MNAVLSAPVQPVCIHCSSPISKGEACVTCKANAPFIIDGGGSHTVLQSNGVEKYLARYEVWLYDPSRGRQRCVERGDSLPFLQAQYGVTDDQVVYWPIGADLPIARIRDKTIQDFQIPFSA